MKWKEMQYVFPKMNFDWVKGGLVYIVVISSHIDTMMGSRMTVD